MHFKWWDFEVLLLQILGICLLSLSSSFWESDLIFLFGISALPISSFLLISNNYCFFKESSFFGKIIIFTIGLGWGLRGFSANASGVLHRGWDLGWGGLEKKKKIFFFFANFLFFSYFIWIWENKCRGLFLMETVSRDYLFQTLDCWGLKCRETKSRDKSVTEGKSGRNLRAI